jgi:PQQ-dependent catabolism-associated CXXCW motif protein
VIIPGSVWVPGAGMGEIAPEVDSAFREQLARATAGDLDRRIVIYCHERCWLSWNAAKRAIRYGYRNVFWYPAGIEGWRAAGLETAVSDEPGT